MLDLILGEGIISKEYYQTLLHERDREDLARKVALILVEEKGALGSNSGLLEILGCCPEDATREASPRSRRRSGNEMDLGSLLGKSYLELLQSDLDDWVLSQEVEDVAEFPTGP
ncbi:hypothetical protein JD844_020112 [Phrynosoma platyrhinos]|uniref:CARD domain-containing protein n=1 Tax=Phrynosoma platyrhinos TaxID=52577 RepID=A0ABQ7TQZ8_PHRPL|nr:hypothetical protein JD844_020112 [Phrynosoma platyrhinos]